MAELTMPMLGAGMEHGVLVKWRVSPGDTVERGDIVAEVETEKGVIEIEVFHSGVVSALLVPEGERVPVGTRLAEINEQGERAKGREVEGLPPAASEEAAPVPAPEEAVAKPSIAAEPSPLLPVQKPQEPQATPGARQLAREEGVDLRGVPGTGKHGVITRGDVVKAGHRRKVSPLARRMAEERGVDLSTVAPGPDGAIHAAQVEAAEAKPQRAPSPSPLLPVQKPTSNEAMRRAIAAAMSQSKREIPHYYLAHTIDFGPATAWLQAQNEERPVPERLLYGVLLLKATALALREVPELNARWTGEGAPPIEAVNLGVAVSLRGGGLIAPAIHDAANESLDELMVAFKDLVKRARTGALRGSELSEGTITVTSLGDRGVETVIPVINPPQVAMVGFGKVVDRPWVVDGEVVPRPTIVASLAADHRVSDGHRGGLYLAAVERLLQTPEEL